MVQIAGDRHISTAWAELGKAVQAKYPDLMLVWEDAAPIFRGTFPVMHEGQVLDRFTIEIAFPDGLSKLPAIREIGGRIPKIRDRHISTADGTICTDVPELILLRGGYSLLSYLEGPVHNYFLGQCFVEHGKPWPFGEWDHGKRGLIEAYGSILGVSGEATIRRYLDCLTHKKIKAHWPCPCGSGQSIKGCHSNSIRELQQRIAPKIAKQALERLRTTS